MPDLSLVAKLSGDQQVNAGLQRIKEKVNEVANASAYNLAPATKSLTSHFGELVSTLGRVGGVAAVGIGAIGAALYPAVKQTLEYADAQNELSQRTGIAVEKLAGYELLAKTSGTTTASVATAVKRLSVNMAEAADGKGKAAQMFKMLNIEVKNTDGTLRNVDDVLGDLADTFAKSQDGPEKIAIAVGLLGRAGEQLIPALNGGRKELDFFQQAAQRAGTTISKETAEAADKFNDSMVVMGATLKGVVITIGTPFVNWLGTAADGMRRAQEQGASFWKVMQEGAIGFFRAMAFGTEKTQLEDVLKQLGSVRDQIAKENEKLAKFQGNTDGGAVTGMATMTQARIKALREQERMLEQNRDRLNDWLAYEKKETEKSVLPTLEKEDKKKKAIKDTTSAAIKAQDEGLRNAMANMDIEIAHGRSTTADKVALIDAILAAEVGSNSMRMHLIKEREKTVEEAYRKEMRTAEIVQRAHEQNAAEQERVMREAVSATVAYADKQIEEIKRTSKTYEEMEARIKAVIAALREAGLAGEQAAEQVEKKNKDVIDRTAKDSERMRDIFGRSVFDMVTVFGRFHSSVQSVFAGVMKGNMSVAEGFKGIWKAAVDSVINEFARLAANETIKWIANLLGFPIGGTGGNPNAGGGLGGILSGVLGSGSGGGDIASTILGGLGTVFGGPIGGFLGGLAGDLFGFDRGGSMVVSKPTLFMAGETGGERVEVKPLGVGSGGSAGVVNQFFGPVVMDMYSAKAWEKTQSRMAGRKNRR